MSPSILRQRVDRRRFLTWSSASLAAMGIGMPPFIRRVAAGPLTQGKKLLFIFLRGGADAVQMAIPFGDQGIPALGVKTYLEARPTLGVSPGDAHDLNGFASLFPSMEGPGETDPKLAGIFHGTLDARPGALAVLHRIGYEAQNRSHFSSQQFWENGLPGELKVEEGVLNRYLTAYKDPASPLQAATLAGNQMVMMKGQTLVPVLRSVSDFGLPANVALGSFPTAEAPLGSGLQGAYGQKGFDATIPYESLTFGVGTSLLESLRFFEENVSSVPYEPEPEAAPFYDAISDANFAGFVRDAARLLKQVDGLQIAGCNQDGYDTHGNENGRFPTLARDLALALTALFFDLAPIWQDTLVITVSEFGRTSEQNGNNGTDHGESTCMLAMGGPVVGGVYNCDPSTWENGDLFSTPNGRYVAHRTDFRAVYHEFITRHLGDPSARIDDVIPGYSQLAASDPNGYFQPLGYLSESEG